MQTDTQKEQMKGIVGTLIFHALVILFLVFYYITPNLPKEKDDELSGVPVMFGNVPDAGGSDQAFGRGEGKLPDATVEESQMQDAPTLEANKPKLATVEDTKTVTQDDEETLALKKEAEKKKKEDTLIKQKEAANAEAKRKEEATAQQKAKAQAEHKKNLNKQMSGLFGDGAGNGSRGNTTGNGTQGVKTGNSNSGKTSGVGGIGTYDLGGRGTNKDGVIMPVYAANDYGTVVVDIIVNPQGVVVETSVGKGTNTPNASLRNAALKAAKQTRFAVVSTLGNQKGTITYRFNLN